MAGPRRALLALSVTGLFLLNAFGLPIVSHAQLPEPFIGEIPGTEFVVTVTEGPGEPRSIGSYAVRLYMPHDPAWPFDAFLAGMVRYRDGAVDALRFADIDGNDAAEIIVVVRSAGSGGNVSADAFSVGGSGLALIGHLEGLLGNADPVAALRRLVSGGVVF